MGSRGAGVEGRTHRPRRWVPDLGMWPPIERLVEASARLLLSHSPRRSSIARRGASASSSTTRRTRGPCPLVAQRSRLSLCSPRCSGRRSTRAAGSVARGQRATPGSRFLLTDILECARCGSALCAANSPGGPRSDRDVRRRWDHFVCVGVRRRHECDMPRLGATNLEEAVTAALGSDVLTEGNRSRRLRGSRASGVLNDQPWREDPCRAVWRRRTPASSAYMSSLVAGRVSRLQRVFVQLPLDGLLRQLHVDRRRLEVCMA